MSIYFRVEKLLLAKFNERNGHSLLPSQVKFSNPRPADSVDPTMAVRYNTAVSLEMLKGSPFDGVATLFYNRIVLSAEFSNSKLLDLNFIKINDERSTSELVPYLNTKLGLHLRTEDIIDEPLNDKGLFTQTRIRIAEGSMEFTGSMDIGIMRINAPLVKMTAKHSPIYIEEARRKAVNARTEAPVFPLNYRIDYSAAFNWLRRIKAADAWGAFPAQVTLNAAWPFTPTTLASCLSKIDGINWSASPSALAAPSLNQAMALYNGPTEDCKVYTYAFLSNAITMDMSDPTWINPANKDFDNVLVLALHNPWYSNNRYKSLVLFHYNGVL